MYGLRFIKGMVLYDTKASNENFFITIRPETEGLTKIQCLHASKIIPNQKNKKDLYYDSKMNAVIFYNESNREYYAVGLNGFSFIDIDKAGSLTSLFFIDQDTIDLITMIFTIKYYGFEDRLIVLSTEAKSLLLSAQVNNTTHSENNISDEEENSDKEDINIGLDPEFIAHSMYESKKEDVRGILENMMDIKDIIFEDAELIVDVFNNRPEGVTKNSLYEDLGTTYNNISKIMKHIGKTFPQLLPKE